MGVSPINRIHACVREKSRPEELRVPPRASSALGVPILELCTGASATRVRYACVRPVLHRFARNPRCARPASWVARYQPAMVEGLIREPNGCREAREARTAP